jgi:glycerol dehydrogenase
VRILFAAHLQFCRLPSAQEAKMSPTPIEIFSADVSELAPKVFFAAHRYVQGPGVLASIGSYLPLVASMRPGILIAAGLPDSISIEINRSLSAAGIRPASNLFGGQCSLDEVEAQVAVFRVKNIDALIGVGGGKAIDTAKCVASRLAIPLIICPTLASSDAPCSAVAVLYTKEGVFAGAEFFLSNPDLVIVDTHVIARAPLRYLLAGIADALATGYEARACLRNPQARSMVGGKISATAAAIAAACSEIVFDQADAAIAAARRGTPDEAFEKIVEANTLLSGTGFESGGLAATHAIASALTAVPIIEHKFLHGEMVAVGIMVQLWLERDVQDFRRARGFLERLGLPVRFSDLGLDTSQDAKTIQLVIGAACAFPFMTNEPFPVSPEMVSDAIKAIEQDDPFI